MIEKVELLKSRDGYNVLGIVKDKKKFHIGNLYNEKREVETFFNAIGDIVKGQNYIVFGLGYLNHIEALLERKHSDNKVLVIECSREIIDFVGHSPDDKAKLILSNKDLLVTSSTDEVKLFLQKYINSSNSKKLKVLPYSGYARYFSQEIEPFYKLVREHCIYHAINNHTASFFEDDWYHNSIRNLSFLNETRTIYPYQNACSDRPAIIVSAGPSLDKNIGILSDERDAVIISGGRTLKSLLNIGVDPDFLVIMDSGKPSYELVKDCLGSTKAKLLYYFGVPTEILSGHQGEKITWHQDAVIGELLQEPLSYMGKGGSVAHAMAALAIELGCNPIIFIGQDLAFTNNRGHSEVANSPWRNGDVSMTPLETARSFYVDDIYGGKVKTSIEWDLYRRQLEKIIEESNGRSFINCTEGGVNIKGSEIATLKEVYSNLAVEKLSISINHSSRKAIDVVSLLRANKRAMIKCVALYTKAAMINEKFIRIVSKSPFDTRAVEKELSKVEKKILYNNHKVLFMSSMISKTLEVLNTSADFDILASDTENEALLKNLTKSKYLYTAMRDKLSDNIRLVEDEIQRLSE